MRLEALSRVASVLPFLGNVTCRRGRCCHGWATFSIGWAVSLPRSWWCGAPHSLFAGTTQCAAAAAERAGVAAEAAEHGHVALRQHRLAQTHGVVPAHIVRPLLTGGAGLGGAVTRIAVMFGGFSGARPFVGMTRLRRRCHGDGNEDDQTQQRGLEHDEPFRELMAALT